MELRPFSRQGLSILAVLLLVHIFNFIDRQLPFILLDGIRRDLNLNDAQIGLLLGVSFAVVYSFSALPLARLADRFSAKWVLSLTLAFWSVATAAGGVAQNFWQMLFARAGVAAGEAGSIPAGHALIARTYRPSSRALVVAIFSLGVPIGSMIGLALGGWINDVAGWRQAFFIIGLPGLAMAVLAWFVLPHAKAEVTAEKPYLPFKDAVKVLLSIPSYRHMLAAASLFAIGSYAMNVFAPAFLMRTHEMSATQAGLALGLVSGLGGFAGTLLGGMLGDHLGKRDPAWRQLVPAICMAICVPVGLVAWLAPNTAISLVFLAIVYLLSLAYYAPTFSAAQMLVPDTIRATTAAFLLFSLTLIGSSVGPYLIGWISDLLAPQYGRFSLRYAMCFLVVTMTWSALHFFLASRSLKADIQKHEATSADALAAHR